MNVPYQRSEPSVPPLTVDEFDAYYRALYNYHCFKWQERLAKQVCRGDWPEYIHLPTASGKTAAIDIAVFALAFQGAKSNRPDGAMNSPRRIFFVVDRRIIVNEAYRRAQRAARFFRKTLDPETVLNDKDARFFDNLDRPRRELLTRVARWLQHLAGDDTAPPLDCFELRGGIYRDDAWVRSPLQPTVLTSTVDQVGSRLLFRGYGVSDRNLSIHAALTANDSLIILDEAHCSKPFSQTMESLDRYRNANWARQFIETPSRFVQMTATPPPDATADNVLKLDRADYEADPPLEKRHGCSKPVSLVLASGAKGKKRTATLAKKLVEQAESFASKYGLRKIAIVVNRVAIAREAFAMLDKKHGGSASLMIGRMRPCDRDQLTDRLQSEFGSGWARKDDGNVEAADVPPQFVVATQCLEVGADLDFDGMVSQCASLDALRQRFGRLNRLGQSPQARGAIVAAEDDIAPLEKLDDAKPLDPIYGNALAHTWHWMHEQDDTTRAADDDAPTPVIDFGIKALDALCLSDAKVDMQDLLAPAPDAPVLMPAHVDLLCQTSPRPKPEPDVAAYLHGTKRTSPEVRVCWRADLELSNFRFEKVEEKWIEAADLCPPSTAECLTVPLNVFRRWLRGEKVVDQSGDVLGETVESADGKVGRARSQRAVLVWRSPRRKGDESQRSFVASANHAPSVRPNDTVVIPAEFGGWKALGHIPQAPPDPADDGDRTKFTTTDPRQLHRMLMNGASDSDPANGPEDEQAVDAGNGATENATDAVRQLATMDVADRAFLQARSRTIWRIHPKLHCEQELHWLRKDLLQEAAKTDTADLAFIRWRRRAEAIRTEPESDENLPTDVLDASRLVRLTQWHGKLVRGQIRRYPGGLAWITERHPRPSLSLETLPLASFGDDDDSLSFTEMVSQAEGARQPLPLSQHLADVADEASRLCAALRVPLHLANAVVAAAKFHDLGKADPRFQAMLLGKPLSVAFMQRQLWAKSDGTARGRASVLPDAFRHEMLSLSLLDHFEPTDIDIDVELLQHAVASHHGYARPFAPLCIDDDPPGLDLRPLGGIVIPKEQRGDWVPAHRLDSGIAERFWELNRRYGWWGLAYFESLLRLADWKASAEPGRGDQFLTFTASSRRPATKPTPSSLTLTGIDGSNPLGFLAALGTLRVLATGEQSNYIRMHWEEHSGAWRAVLSSHFELDEDNVIDRLTTLLATPPQLPLFEQIGPNLTISGHRFRNLAQQAVDACHQVPRHSTRPERTAVDFVAAFGCDTLTVDGDPDSTMQDTALRTMSGAGHQHFIAFMCELITSTDAGHLRSTLFAPWEYLDAGRGANLRWDPSDDRRYAVRWKNPSTDPNMTMRGANRLAIEALPLFTTIPSRQTLETTGFTNRHREGVRWTWPIWTVPIDLETCRSLLQSSELQPPSFQAPATEYSNWRSALVCRSVAAIFQSQRITIGKFRNFTPSRSL